MLAVLVSAGAMFAAQTRLSPVNDEPANLPSGYVFMKTGRYVDATHPPLVRYVMAVPLLFMDPSPLPDNADALRDWHPFGRAFIFQNDVSWQAILWSARAAVIALSAACLVLVFAWARRLWGSWPAAFATVFLAFEPTLMGHGALATLDMGSSFLFFATVASYWRYRRRPTTGAFVLFAVILSTALMSKFSLAVLLVALPLTALLSGRVQGAPRWFVRLGIGLATFTVITCAAYGFQSRTMAEDPQIVEHRKSASIARGIDRVAAELGTDRATLMNQPIPLYDLVKGAGLQLFHAAAQDQWEDANFYQYLNGDYSRSGWRTYYLWTFALKSSLPTLVVTALLIPAAFGAGFRRRRGVKGQGPDLWPFLVIPPLLYLAACSAATINIGHRYLLPLYPFVAMGAGWLFSLASGKVSKALLVGVLTWHVGAAGLAWPHYIAYFNEAVGGTSAGHRHLVDSNVDWGQDLLFLKDDVAARRSEGQTVYGDLFGTVRPADLGYDLEAIPRDPGALAGPATLYISVNRWRLKSERHPRGLYPWLDGREPDRWVGSSIAVFRQ